MAKPEDIRIAVVVEEESLVRYREWAATTQRLQVAANRAVEDLSEHLRHGVPTIFATFDPTVEIEEVDSDRD